MIKTTLSICTLGGWLASMALAADNASKQDHGAPMPAMEAVAVLVPTSNSNVTGTILLHQQGDAVHVTGEIRGLKPGLHGFHIHEFGDQRTPDGSGAGGHYAPQGHKHGGLDSKERHAGDLGNIKAGSDGVARVDVVAPDLKLHYITGRSVVVHADPDDLKSQPAGNSGPRIAVGVIGVAQQKAN